MSELASWIVVLGLAVGTFLIRYSFIGLFANRSLPGWVVHGLKLVVPAIFAAIVASSLAIVGGQIAGLAEHWPRYAAAIVALAAALRWRGSVPITLVTGMVALHLFTALGRYVAP